MYSVRTSPKRAVWTVVGSADLREWAVAHCAGYVDTWANAKPKPEVLVEPTPLVYDRLVEKLGASAIEPKIHQDMAARKAHRAFLAAALGEAREDIGVDVDLSPDQADGVRFLFHQERAVLAYRVGKGKGLVVSTPVLTPLGWRTIGEIRPGDQLIGSDGRPTTVRGVYHQGMLPTYRVTFSDGAWIDCDGTHQWQVWDTRGFFASDFPKIATTAGLLRRGYRTKRNAGRYRIPMVSPVHFAVSAPLPVDPYLLGVLLGDGYLAPSAVAVTTADVDLLDSLATVLPEGVTAKHRGAYDYGLTGARGRGSNPLLDALRDLGLAGTHAESKFVPDAYLWASPDDRLALLQGLMDTDGSVSRDGTRVTFKTISIRLAESVQHLVQSLGGTASIRPVWPTYTYAGKTLTGQVAYGLSLRMPPGVIPFRLARKAKLLPKFRKYAPTRLIEDITPIGEREIVCLAVDAPDQLYVAKDFIVTHNTRVAATVAMLETAEPREPWSQRTLVACPAKVTYQWAEEVARHVSPDWPVVVLDGTLPERVAAVQTAPHNALCITSWNSLTPTGSDRWVEEWWAGLDDARFQVVIADEAQRLGNRKGQQANRFLDYAKTARCVYTLSGTPTDGKVDAWFGILRTVDPDRFTSYWRWVGMFVDTLVGYDRRYSSVNIGNGFAGAKHVDILEDILADYVITREWTEEERNPLERITVPVQMSPEQAKAYLDLETRFMLETDNGTMYTASHAGMRIRLAQLTLDPALVGLTAPAVKVDTLVEFLRERVPADDSVVVATYLVNSVNQKDNAMLWNLKRRIETEAGREVELIGSMTAKRDAVARNAWLAAKPGRVVVMSTAAGGEGLNLQEANWLIFMDRPWSMITNLQAEGRVDRYGQKKLIRYVDLTAIDTLDEQVRDVLQSKLYMHDLLFASSVISKRAARRSSDSKADLTRD